jgi:adenine/guanine phosphoribosyltransferase-like PRPP-binding protein
MLGEAGAASVSFAFLLELTALNGRRALEDFAVSSVVVV